MDTGILFSSSSEAFGVDVRYEYTVNDKTTLVLRGVANRERANVASATAGESLRASLVHHYKVGSDDWPVAVKLVAWAGQGKNLSKWGAKAIATKELQVDEDTVAEAKLAVSNRALADQRNILLTGTLKRRFTIADDEWMAGLQCSTEGRCALGVQNGMLSVQKVLSKGGKTGEPGEWRAKYTLSGKPPKLFF